MRFDKPYLEHLNQRFDNRFHTLLFWQVSNGFKSFAEVCFPNSIFNSHHYTSTSSYTGTYRNMKLYNYMLIIQ